MVAGCRLRSCVWPFDAVHVIASLDEVRTLQAALILQPAYSVARAELALACGSASELLVPRNATPNMVRGFNSPVQLH